MSPYKRVFGGYILVPGGVPRTVCPICDLSVGTKRKHLRKHLNKCHLGAFSPFPSLLPHQRSNRSPEHRGTVEETGIPVEKVSFELLPPGSWGIEHIITYYSREADRFPSREIQWNRLTAIKSLGPIKCYVGTELWLGYVLFEFSHSDRVVLECPIDGNATYVLSGDWKRMVAHSKLYLLTNFSHNCAKIIHKGDWIARIKSVL